MSSMNFTCDVCGREVFSCTFVNGMKFCAKCYQETFGETDKDRKIADLEAKLAECEKKNFELVAQINLKEHKPAFCTLADRDCEALGQVAELKQQLAITEKALELACEPRDDWGGEKYSGTEYDNYYDYFMAEAKEMLGNE